MRSLLLGARSGDVAEIASLIERTLGYNFQERESDYFGTYRIAKADGLQIKVVSLLDPEGAPLEEGFGGFETLIYADGDLSGIQFGTLTVPQGPLEKLRGGAPGD